jgi:hypothetical protein
MFFPFAPKLSSSQLTYKIEELAAAQRAQHLEDVEAVVHSVWRRDG